MAITVTVIVQGGNKTSQTSTALGTVPTDYAIGSLILIAIAADNAGTSGVSSISTPTDTKGNTYSPIKTENRTSGSALDGVTVALYGSVLTAALLNADSDHLTLNFSPATLAKAYVLVNVAGSSGYAYATDNASGSGTTFTSNVSVSMGTGDLYFGVVGNESNNQPALDSDTSNGSWDGSLGGQSGGTGGDGTKMSVAVEYKITTGHGTQTLNAATGANTDWALVAGLFAPLLVPSEPKAHNYPQLLAH